MAGRLVLALALLASLGFTGEDEVELGCPSGSRLRERGDESACETRAGVGEGPFWARRDDGSLRFWGTARGGKTEGRWIAWHPNGAKSIEATYRSGELVGRFQMWNENDQLVYAGVHDSTGEMHGTWRRWWPNGRERMRWEMRHGIAHGPVVSSWEGGGRRFEGQRENGQREGHWTWWSEDGATLASCRFADDVVVEGVCATDPP